MSSSYNYLPIPPRVWSRVQNLCTYDVSGSTYSSAYIPLTNQTVSQAQANYEDKLLYKGNILQYKGNSSRLTRQQKYSQLAKSLGPNRTKVFATQSQTYTNPNTTWLQRVNYATVPFPNTIVGQPNNISGPFQYNVSSPYGCSTTSVQEGGNLVCGTYVNPCTNQIIKTAPAAPLCFPSYCSDVPGRPIELCWNPKVQTWFPRQRFTMSNSGSKWPEGYKGFVSAVTPEAPVLTLDAYTCTSASLSWTDTNNNCIPISSYNIYQNGVILKTVPYTITSTIINNLADCGIYSFYVTAVSNTTQSFPSNIINIGDVPNTPIDFSGNATGINQIQFSWTQIQNCCTVSKWIIYYTPVVINSTYYSNYAYNSSTMSQIVTSNPATITGLINDATYSSYIVAVSTNGEMSEGSSSINVNNPLPYTLSTTPSYYSGFVNTDGNYLLTIGAPQVGSTNNILTFLYSNIDVSFVLVGGGGGGGIGKGNGGGGGGGGGGVLASSFLTTAYYDYNISIGLGGLGGDGTSQSGNSGSTTVISPIATTQLLGGKGGEPASNNDGGAGGAGGDALDGGNGGDGGTNGGPGNPGSASLAYVYYYSNSFGPGGGGGGGGGSVAGGSPGNEYAGYGGPYGTSYNYLYGQDASFNYGGGGGGGAGTGSNSISYGGNGGNGCAFLYFKVVP
jgi:hypothetical protein